MPLIRISLRAGKSASYRRAIADNVYQALRETFDVPEHDFFATIAEHQPEDFFSIAAISTSSAATIWRSSR
jgi:4-oxalocrotonate tautomerase